MKFVRLPGIAPAVVRPNQPSLTRWKGLVIAQAGATNFLKGLVVSEWA